MKLVTATIVPPGSICLFSSIAMDSGSNQFDKDSNCPDALPVGESMEHVVSMSVGRVYPPGMGLRPKACPRPRKVTSTTTRSERSIQGPVDRCLTLVRALTPEVPDNSGVESCALRDAPVDVQNCLTSDPWGVRQEARPGQSANRDRTQSWWDVQPIVPKCGMACLMCGAPCNRTLGKHFIRLADDNPAHLCFHHDLHELYGESSVNSQG